MRKERHYENLSGLFLGFIENQNPQHGAGEVGEASRVTVLHLLSARVWQNRSERAT